MRRAEEVTFGAPALDRAAHLRARAEEIAATTAARSILFWRGKVAVAGEKLVRLPLSHRAFAEGGLGQVFLGLDGVRPVFATDISEWAPEQVDEEAMGRFFDPNEYHHPDVDGAFVELRGVMTRLSPEEAALAATARALFSWHQSHGHCARCGAQTGMGQGGWQRGCTECGAQHFPRTDPVVIVLATHGNSVLLGRSPGWPEGMYSLLAGFVEPGETIEAATRREVFEEAGIRLGQVVYCASQPWPFPTSLMFGTRAEALGTEITLDPLELEDARWVTREEMLEAVAGRGEIKPARPGSIARFLIEAWLSDDLD